jgi:hypothetical protein
VLLTKKVEMTPPDEIGDKTHVIYDVDIENGGIRDNDTFAVRLLNPYDDATVYAYADGSWSEVESKERGHYLQVTMTGPQQYFCIVDNKSNTVIIIACAAAAVVVFLLFVVIVKNLRTRRRNKKLAKQQNNE